MNVASTGDNMSPDILQSVFADLDVTVKQTGIDNKSCGRHLTMSTSNADLSCVGHTTAMMAMARSRAECCQRACSQCKNPCRQNTMRCMSTTRYVSHTPSLILWESAVNGDPAPGDELENICI